MQKTSRRVLALVLSLVLALSVFSISASAYNAGYQSETHTVFKHYTQTLAPGVEYYNNYAYLSDGEQVVYYAAVADINRDDVIVQGSYWNSQTEQYGMAKLTEQVASANAKYSDPDDEDFISENYTVVAGTNGDFYNMQTGRPSGAFAINGHVMNESNNRPWFAIFEDGTALCGSGATDYAAAVEAHGAVQNSVGGSQMLVVNGEDVTATASGSYNTDRHSRTMIGVTADNKVVSVVVDGRQSPFSAGGSMHELAQIMIEAECVTAINLDGGGSTTFGARPEGEDDFKVINRPSDGSERSISSGVIIASLAAPSNVFDHVAFSVADDYVTPGTSTTFTAAGVSTSGASADIPAEVTYEAVNGAIDGNTVTATAAGEVVINAKLDGNVVGTVSFNAVIPDTIAFAQETFTVPYDKTVDLGIVAKYGLNEVVTKPADFEYTLEIPQDAGQIVDGAMVAPAESSEAAANTVTATLIADNTKTTTANIVFGKASQVLFDFEDGTTQKWVRYNTSNYNYIHTRGTTSNVTAENGQVHSGEHALKISAKFSETWEAGYISGRAGVYGMDEVIDLKGATRLGMWMYIPIANASFNGRMFLCKVTERDEETGAITNYQGYYTDTKIDQGGNWNCGFVTQYDEPGWHYVYFDLSSDTDWCIIKNATLLDFYINDRNGDSFGYNHLNYTNGNADLNLYIDDVTVDYSSVVEDRDAPVFTEVKLGDEGNYSNEGLVLARGSNYESNGYNKIDLSARVADYSASNATGLNASSAKVYLDGVEFPCTFANGIITAPTYTYTNGKHTVKFAIKDNNGNYASAIRTFTVKNTAKDQPVWIEAKDPEADKILFGSLYWVNVKAADAASVSSVNVDLDLDNLSNWELDHMEVAQGFDADYVISNADENIATLTITRNSDTIALLDGDALVSMPIHTWELPAVAANYGHAGVVWMYNKYKSGNEVWPVNVIVNVAAGQVTFSDDSTEIFKGDEVNVRTESIYWDNDNAKASDEYYTSWNGGHDHRPETAEYYADGTTNHTTDDDIIYVEGYEPVAATCTEEGFSGRTFCTVCNSVVDWGHVIPATGHSYAIDEEDGLMKCTVCKDLCNEVVDGKLYQEGVLYTGFYESKYYIDGEAQDYTGIVLIEAEGKYYEFDENHLNQGVYTGVFEENGKYYYAQLGTLSSGWKQIDGDWYYFRTSTMYAASGSYTVNGVDFEFEENGKLVSGVWVNDGVGTKYYYGPGNYKSGNTASLQWAEIDGATYGFDPNGYRYEGDVVARESNAPLKAYEFTDEGVYVGLSTATGIIPAYNSVLYYCVDGALTAAGMIQIGDDYYYARTGGVIAVGNYYCTYTNGLKDPGTYTFGSDGKMIEDPAELNNGLVDGYYYVDGKLVYAGLIEIDGDYYYIKSNCHYVTGSYYVTKTNGLMPQGTYNFGDDGKMIIEQPHEPLNGIVDGYYYVNDVKTYAGLIELDGGYYYIRTGGVVATGKYYVTVTNDLLPQGIYDFGEDGKLVIAPAHEPLNGIVDGYYYVNDVKTYAGLIELNGDYYYIKTGGVVATGNYYVTKTNDLMPQGIYTFGDDGKMILPEPEPQPDPQLNGIVDGVYYVDGVATYAGLIEIDGDYYYIRTGGVVATGKYYVTKTNDLMPQGIYVFGDDGKMVQ